METWTRGPLSDSPSYSGLRLHEQTFEEGCDGHVAVNVPACEVRAATLSHGLAAERPVVQLCVGLILVSFSAWGAISWSGIGGRDRFLPGAAAASCLLLAGVWLLGSLLRRRYFLALSTSAGVRKLVFDENAEPRGSLSFWVRDDVLEELPETFAQWLCEHITSGNAIEDRQTIQYGTFILLTEVRERNLTVLAPGAGPDEWSPDLSRCLEVALLQRYVADSYGLAPEPPSALQLVSVDPEAEVGPVLMARVEPEPQTNHSGWCIWAAGGDLIRQRGEREGLLHLALGDFFLFRPDLLEYLALPYGVQADVVGTTPRVHSGETELLPEPGSYLHARLNGVTPPPSHSGSA